MILPVKLATVGENASPCRHVQPQGERLGRKQHLPSSDCMSERCLTPACAHLDESFLKENLNQLAQDGEEARVVHTDAAAEEREDVLDLGEILIFFRQPLQRLFEHFLDREDLTLAHKPQAPAPRRLQRQGLALPSAECEHNRRTHAAIGDERDYLHDVRLLPPLGLGFCAIVPRCHHLHEVLFEKVPCLIKDKKDAVSSRRKHEVLQRSRSEVCLDYVAGKSFEVCNPLGKLQRVWNCC
eukprot:747341-Hanusia_phi.AAC.1